MVANTLLHTVRLPTQGGHTQFDGGNDGGDKATWLVTCFQVENVVSPFHRRIPMHHRVASHPSLCTRKAARMCSFAHQGTVDRRVRVAARCAILLAKVCVRLQQKCFCSPTGIGCLIADETKLFGDDLCIRRPTRGAPSVHTSLAVPLFLCSHILRKNRVCIPLCENLAQKRETWKNNVIAARCANNKSLSLLPPTPFPAAQHTNLDNRKTFGRLGSERQVISHRKSRNSSNSL